MQNRETDLKPLRQTAAFLLAAAVRELVPAVELIDGGATRKGFSYRFRTETSPSKDFLLLIEERMRMLSKELILPAEMIPKNAAEFLRHLGLKKRAEIARHCEHGLVRLIRIGEFADISMEEFSEEVPNFKLVSVSAIGNEFLIEGLAEESKEKLKGAQKKVNELEKFEYAQLAERLGLFEIREGKWIFREKGAELLRNLMDFWGKAHQKAGFEVVHTPEMDIEPLSIQSAEMRFHPYGGWDEAAFFSCKREEIEKCIISSLKFIEENLKILELNFRWILVEGSREKRVFLKAVEALKLSYTKKESHNETTHLVCQIADLYGNWQDGPTIESVVVGKETYVKHRLFGDIRDLIGHLLEQCRGELPLWLSSGKGEK